MLNHNRLLTRVGLPLALVGTMAGSAACGSAAKPRPNPYPSATEAVGCSTNATGASNPKQVGESLSFGVTDACLNVYGSPTDLTVLGTLGSGDTVTLECTTRRPIGGITSNKEFVMIGAGALSALEPAFDTLPLCD